MLGDYNFDGHVDGNDLAQWGASFGFDAAGDADADGDSDGGDFLAWQRRIGAPLAPGVGATFAADFDADADTDGADFLAWQRGVGAPPSMAIRSNGDADGDHDVDRANLDVWTAAFGSRKAAAAATLVVHVEPAAENLGAVKLPSQPLTAELIDAAMALSVTNHSEELLASRTRTGGHQPPIEAHRTASLPGEMAAAAESDAGVFRAESSTDNRAMTRFANLREDFVTERILERLIEPVYDPQ
jgi:hypothetical protein